MNIPSIIKRLFLVVAIFFTITLAIIQTHYAKKYIANKIITGVETTSEYSITIDKIGGIIPFSFSLYDVSVTKNGSPVAEISRIGASWSSPMAFLFNKEIRLDALAIDMPTIHASEGSSEAYISWPNIPWRVTARNVSFTRYTTAAGVIVEGHKGTASCFRGGGDVIVTQHLVFSDMPSLIADIAFYGDATEKTVSVSCSAEKRRSSIFSIATPTISCGFDIERPWQAFQDIINAGENPLFAAVQGTAYYTIQHHPLTLLTSSMTRSIFGDSWHHEGTFVINSDRSFSVEFPSFENEGVIAEGSCFVDAEKVYYDTFFTISIPDLSHKKHLLLHDLEGEVTLTAKAFNTIASPRIALSMAGSDIIASGRTINPVDGAITFDIADSALKGHGALSTAIDDVPLQASVEISGTLEETPSLSFHNVAVIVADTHHFAGTITTTTSRSALRAGRLSAAVAVTDGIYKNYKQGTVFRDINAALRVTSKKILIKEIAAKSRDKGFFSASGVISLSGKKHFPYDIAFGLNDIVFIDSDPVYAVASGELDLYGTSEKHNIDGDLAITKSRVSIPDKLPITVTTLPVKYVYEDNNGTIRPINNAAIKTKSAPIALDITMSFPDNALIVGRGLTSEWQGNVDISGTSTAPELSGKLTNTRGTFMFSGRPFTLREGAITFDSASADDIYIATSAEYDVDDITAEISLKGPLNNIRISVTSIPLLPIEEVLARVMFGTKAKELTGLQGIRLAQTITALAGSDTAPDVLGKVGQSLGLDQLDISNTNDETYDPSVKIGKYVMHNILFSVQKSFLSDTNTFAVEADISKLVKLSADIDNNAKGNIFLKWQQDY